MFVEWSEAVAYSLLSGECLWSGVRLLPTQSYLVDVSFMPFLCSLVFTEATVMFRNLINWRCMLVSVALDAISV